MSKGMLGAVSVHDARGTLADLLEKLGGDDGQDWLRRTKRFLRKENPWPDMVGDESVTAAVVKHVVDCSAPAFCPEGWKVAPKAKQVPSSFKGELALTSEMLALHLDPGQQGDKVIKGTELRKALAGQSVMPANVLDHLLAHPEFIPDSWKNACVFFWGTVYRDSRGYLCVRSLCWRGGGWDWDCDWLEDDWDSGRPSAVLASI